MSNETLLKQLANRAKTWHQNTGISQAALAAALNMEEGNYSGFLKGKRGISAEATCTLLEFIKLSKRNAIAKLNKPVLRSRILELQELGRPMSFSNDGWVPGQSSQDPNGTTRIDNTTDAQKATIEDLLDVFNTLDSVSRQTVIDAITKAHANANGTTAPTTQKFHRHDNGS